MMREKTTAGDSTLKTTRWGLIRARYLNHVSNKGVTSKASE
ncbi:MAG: hypothetical protein ABIN01_25205 [Ferruginibacter sp.]